MSALLYLYGPHGAGTYRPTCRGAGRVNSVFAANSPDNVSPDSARRLLYDWQKYGQKNFPGRPVYSGNVALEKLRLPPSLFRRRALGEPIWM